MAPVAMALVPKLIITNSEHAARQPGVPCGDVVDMTTSIADGRMEITATPLRADVLGPLPVTFDLTRLELFFTPFKVHHECLGISATVAFREIGVRLARAVRFTGEGVDGQYRFSIPKEQFLIFETVLDNLPFRQPETRYQRPSEDVTGVIDPRLGTAQLHVVLASLRPAGSVHNAPIDELPGANHGRHRHDSHAPARIRIATACRTGRQLSPRRQEISRRCDAGPGAAAGCDADLVWDATGTAHASDVCNARPVAITNNAPARFAVGPNVVRWRASDGIDPAVFGNQLVTVAGPDRTPPTVSCTALTPPGGGFKVAAVDDCGGPTTLKLGAFSLANGDVIKIEQTGKPGVRLINTVGNDTIRHFQVGKGQAVIVATDASGNIARAACGAPTDITPR